MGRLLIDPLHRTFEGIDPSYISLLYFTFALSITVIRDIQLIEKRRVYYYSKKNVKLITTRDRLLTKIHNESFLPKLIERCLCFGLN